MTNKLPKPEKGDKPKKIKVEGQPGGPHTPGAKAERERLKKNQQTDSSN